MRLPPPKSTLFPYTTLFRSKKTSRTQGGAWGVERGAWSGKSSSRSDVAAQRDMNARLALARREDLGSAGRSEEHTSELQSLRHLVCRLLLEKKKETYTIAVA